MPGLEKAGDAEKIEPCGDGQRLGEVGEEEHCPFEDRYQHHLAALIVAGDFLCQFMDSLNYLLMSEQYLFQIFVHGSWLSLFRNLGRVFENKVLKILLIKQANGNVRIQLPKALDLPVLFGDQRLLHGCKFNIQIAVRQVEIR